ncbi:hypothetical protein PCE1_003807 [Barthelona sp. PCE]
MSTLKITKKKVNDCLVALIGYLFLERRGKDLITLLQTMEKESKRGYNRILQRFSDKFDSILDDCKIYGVIPLFECTEQAYDDFKDEYTFFIQWLMMNIPESTEKTYALDEDFSEDRIEAYVGWISEQLPEYYDAKSENMPKSIRDEILSQCKRKLRSRSYIFAYPQFKEEFCNRLSHSYVDTEMAEFCYNSLVDMKNTYNCKGKIEKKFFEDYPILVESSKLIDEEKETAIDEEEETAIEDEKETAIEDEEERKRMAKFETEQMGLVKKIQATDKTSRIPFVDGSKKEDAAFPQIMDSLTPKLKSILFEKYGEACYIENDVYKLDVRIDQLLFDALMDAHCLHQSRTVDDSIKYRGCGTDIIESVPLQTTEGHGYLGAGLFDQDHTLMAGYKSYKSTHLTLNIFNSVYSTKYRTFFSSMGGRKMGFNLFHKTQKALGKYVRDAYIQLEKEMLDPRLPQLVLVDPNTCPETEEVTRSHMWTDIELLWLLKAKNDSSVPISDYPRCAWYTLPYGCIGLGDHIATVLKREYNNRRFIFDPILKLFVPVSFYLRPSIAAVNEMLSTQSMADVDEEEKLAGLSSVVQNRLRWRSMMVFLFRELEIKCPFHVLHHGRLHIDMYANATEWQKRRRSKLYDVHHSDGQAIWGDMFSLGNVQPVKRRDYINPSEIEHSENVKRKKRVKERQLQIENAKRKQILKKQRAKEREEFELEEERERKELEEETKSAPTRVPVVAKLAPVPDRLQMSTLVRNVNLHDRPTVVPFGTGNETEDDVKRRVAFNMNSDESEEEI